MPAGAVCLRQMHDDPSKGRASQAALEVSPSRRRFLHRRQYSKQRQPPALICWGLFVTILNPKHTQRLTNVLHNDGLALPAVVEGNLLRC
jgi:hypothetical protein